MPGIRVLIADDHTLVRAGLRALLSGLPDIEVVAEAGDGRQALECIKEYQPDVALIDIAMSGLNGLEAASRAKQDFPSVRVIMVSMHANEEYVLQSLRIGADGYLLKDASAPELEIAIRAVIRGERYLSPAVSKRVVDDYLRRVSGPETGETSSGLAQLTSRQREILQLIAEGHTTQEISQLLGVSAKTVETHRAQLMERLDIHDIAGLVRFAIRTGIVSSDR
jgi:DNA-binding NarL/FixJ family response regulator